MTTRFQKYMNEIPEDFEFLLKALKHNFRIRLSLLLLEKGDLSLSKIATYLKKENSYILNHMKGLEIAGITQNYLQKIENNREYSFYKLTNYGKKIIPDLISLFDDKNLNYQSTIPDTFKFALNAVSNKIRFALLLFLIDNGPTSFTEIVEITRSVKSLVANHVKKLELGALVQNYFEKVKESNDYSFYKITVFGKSIVSGLLNNYNDYYSDSGNNEYEEIEDKVERYFEADCNRWVLPNEKILCWIEVFSQEVFELKIIISSNLSFSALYNVQNELDLNFQEIILKTSEINLNYLPFEAYSKIPKGNNPINYENIRLIAFDNNNQELAKIELEIEVLKPIVELKVENKEFAPQKGYFELSLSFLKDIQIKVLDIEIEVFNDIGQLIEIDKKIQNPAEIKQDIPPEIKLDNLLGKFVIKARGNIYFHFKIPFIDAFGNSYFSNTEIIELKNIENYQENFDCNYNFLSQIAVT